MFAPCPDAFRSSCRILRMDSFMPATKVGSFRRPTSCTARSTIGYLSRHTVARRRPQDYWNGGAPVEFLHDLPGNIGLRHVLELWVRGELLLRYFVHAREEGRHPLLQDTQAEGSHPRTVRGLRQAVPTLCRNSFSNSRRSRSNSPDFLNLGTPELVINARAPTVAHRRTLPPAASGS